MVQVLSVVTITLCVVFFIVFKILSRIKNQARGNPDSGKPSEFKLAAPETKPVVERIKLECPAIIERSQGFTKVGIKEITLIGAFVTCPRPFPGDDEFQIKIFLDTDKSLVIKADVLWNNSNVPRDQIIARGMKVRFLQISDDERDVLREIISARKNG